MEVLRKWGLEKVASGVSEQKMRLGGLVVMFEVAIGNGEESVIAMLRRLDRDTQAHHRALLIAMKSGTPEEVQVMAEHVLAELSIAGPR